MLFFVTRPPLKQRISSKKSTVHVRIQNEEHRRMTAEHDDFQSFFAVGSDLVEGLSNRFSLPDQDNTTSAEEACISISESVCSIPSPGDSCSGESRDLESDRKDEDDDSKHNKYCHYCQHVKVKASAMLACSNKGCARRFCEPCIVRQLGEKMDSLCAFDTSGWKCPICRKLCCCAQQTCDKSHRHCKAYRYRRRRAEISAKKQSSQSILETSALLRRRENDSSNSIPGVAKPTLLRAIKCPDICIPVGFPLSLDHTQNFPEYASASSGLKGFSTIVSHGNLADFSGAPKHTSPHGPTLFSHHRADHSWMNGSFRPESLMCSAELDRMRVRSFVAESFDRNRCVLDSQLRGGKVNLFASAAETCDIESSFDCATDKMIEHAARLLSFSVFDGKPETLDVKNVNGKIETDNWGENREVSFFEQHDAQPADSQPLHASPTNVSGLSCGAATCKRLVRTDSHERLSNMASERVNSDNLFYCKGRRWGGSCENLRRMTSGISPCPSFENLGSLLTEPNEVSGRDSALPFLASTTSRILGVTNRDPKRSSSWDGEMSCQPTPHIKPEMVRNTKFSQTLLSGQPTQQSRASFPPPQKHSKSHQGHQSQYAGNSSIDNILALGVLNAAEGADDFLAHSLSEIDLVALGCMDVAVPDVEASGPISAHEDSEMKSVLNTRNGRSIGDLHSRQENMSSKFVDQRYCQLQSRIMPTQPSYRRRESVCGTMTVSPSAVGGEFSGSGSRTFFPHWEW